ncbi:uncharacterized protein LOC135698613 [Ochlerotatus camptorhynchus]|uniref:uncharacterized protein LOC135698613 n=1 Tax=Ochlerotatus camptorhynchus TaxID=644619 RepID=UPI0031D6D2DB
MPRKRCKMPSKVTIQNLPDEMLEKILLLLELEDRKSALCVCQRWSGLKPFDWSSVQLVVDFGRNAGKEADYHQTLLACNRRYKHLVFYFGYDFEKYDLFVDILSHFSRSVQSLKLMPNTFVPVRLKFFAKIAALCSNLKHLHIDACNFDYSRSGLEFAPMNNLEELYLENNLLSLIPNMQEITPNITRLHMQISYYSEESRNFLRHFSSRLLELEIWFLSEDYFLTVCTMHFPLLEKLNFYCVDLEVDYAESNGEMDPIYQFFQRLPGLKEVTLRCNMVDRVVRSLCQSCRNIEFLCLSMESFREPSFRAVCQLKHLKRLRIEDASISVPLELNCPPLKSLQVLSLYTTRIDDQAEFNQFLLYAFPSLAVLEMLHLSSRISQGRTFELHGNICSNMSSLQRLVLSEPAANIQLGPFLEFCASRGPRELRIKCWNVLDMFPLDEPRSIPVQTLILDAPLISPMVLQNLIKSMGELRRLELALADYCSPEVIRSLRARFPRCEVIARRRVQIEEPL